MFLYTSNSQCAELVMGLFLYIYLFFVSLCDCNIWSDLPDSLEKTMATTNSEAKWDMQEKMVLARQENMIKMQEDINAMKANLGSVKKTLNDLGDLKTW